MLTREFSSSFLQKAVCRAAALCKCLPRVCLTPHTPFPSGSVASSEVLWVFLIYTIQDTMGSFMFFVVVGIFFFLLWRCQEYSTTMWIKGSSPLNKRGRDRNQLTPLVEMLQLQSSRVADTYLPSLANISQKLTL